MDALEKILKDIDDYFQEANSDPVERLKRINEVGGYINYSRRLTELSDEERQDYAYCHQGYPLTDEQRKTLDESEGKILPGKGGSLKDYYIELKCGHDLLTFVDAHGKIIFMVKLIQKPTLYIVDIQAA